MPTREPTLAEFLPVFAAVAATTKAAANGFRGEDAPPSLSPEELHAFERAFERECKARGWNFGPSLRAAK